MAPRPVEAGVTPLNGAHGAVVLPASVLKALEDVIRTVGRYSQEGFTGQLTFTVDMRDGGAAPIRVYQNIRVQ